MFDRTRPRRRAERSAGRPQPAVRAPRAAASPDAGELDPAALDELVRLLQASNVDELEVEVPGRRLYLRREPLVPSASAPPPPPPPASQVVPAPAVGVFHRGLEAGAPPVVADGARVEQGQVVGVIEVLRIPHPVEAPVAGTIERFLVESNQPVEYGQPLLVLRPEGEAPAPETDARPPERPAVTP
ncbi:MAG TPA: acetyl-CoA carboxylase biotin carboxyl carrier protein subunit [Chloroflexota bacterium]|nr:acetyl-CoA carboxylase biotin carboxyl carrier protein subunit [Chloroflexota bacterium]HZU04401.1 acetyl-CoA carboxylase biotin carboxyl carrier protein subunit [Chloroflexota bacterium]